MARCLLGLGSNLGDRGELLRQVVGELMHWPHVRPMARSRWYETAPIGGPSGQDFFLNAALLLDTTLDPKELVASLQQIEQRLGRERRIRWDARSIDIDVLLYGSQAIQSPDLTIPHPRMSFRKFVLEPAAEIAGWMVHPSSGWIVAQLLSHLDRAARYVAVCAAEAAHAIWLEEELTQALGCLKLEDIVSNTGLRADAPPQKAVKFDQWAAFALDKSSWEKHTDLSRRLDKEDEPSVAAESPVTSCFWSRAVGIPANDSVCPTVVIAWEPASNPTLPEVSQSKKKNSEFSVPNMSHSTFRNFLDRQGHGPLARIQTDNPAVALQEAIAVVQSVWPELPRVSNA